MPEDLILLPDPKPKRGKVTYDQSVFVGGDMTPQLTDDQVRLIQLQRADADTRRRTKKGTTGEGVVIPGATGAADNPIKHIGEAFAPRSLEQATNAARFLHKRTGRVFHVMPCKRRAGGFVCISGKEASRRGIEGEAVVTFAFVGGSAPEAVPAPAPADPPQADIPPQETTAKPKRARKKKEEAKPAEAPSPYRIYEIGTPDFGHNAAAIEARQEAEENGVDEASRIAGGWYIHLGEEYDPFA